MVEIDLSDRPAWLYEKNPAGKVPVWEEDGWALAESAVISEYLEELHPDPPLWPADAAQRAAARLLVFRFDDFSRPYYALRRGEAGARERFEDELRQLDSLLERLPYLTGVAFGLADTAYLPWVLRARDLLAVALEPWPALTAWVERVSERPRSRRSSTSWRRCDRDREGGDRVAAGRRRARDPRRPLASWEHTGEVGAPCDPRQGRSRARCTCRSTSWSQLPPGQLRERLEPAGGRRDRGLLPLRLEVGHRRPDPPWGGVRRPQLHRLVARVVARRVAARRHRLDRLEKAPAESPAELVPALDATRRLEAQRIRVGDVAVSSASQLSTISCVTSAWNWIPTARPRRKAWFETSLRASSVAPAGSS